MRGDLWDVPLSECPASARSDAEFMYHPARPFDAVSPMFEKRPMSVIRLPLSAMLP